MNWIKIDEAAKITGITKRAIRYYEEIGLIQPPERSDGQVRLYTDEDIKQLKRVVDAKEVLGFSLQELQHFLSIKERVLEHKDQYESTKDTTIQQSELEEIADGLKEQEKMLQQKMEKMKSFQEELKDLIQKVDSLLNV
ncbi:DNA-binding transcriptional regulator, MerR family [Fictibacillus solisalsi]|uniref:DNA-binding transcriptional regulator, MerR family n=1 Tax=Fictibacillus solisalsi TaxID=459525 RepID=A0A1G9XBX7_9BACL|nr:MerR family transcriptional regulator [Fictibacillus solisalsi]SDM94302.1 DNA-binding transcriptional regulator, MerR family [Fictibacillus solisalsi]